MVVFDSYIEISVTGKTGQGILIIVKAYRDLVNHLENHPLRDNPDAPLWYMIRGNQILPLSYNALRMRIKRLTQKAGIKRRVWIHLFRHSAATRMAVILTDREMCEMFRWSRNSRMPARYAHLSAKAVKDKLLLMYHDQHIIEKPKITRCWRCNEILQTEVQYCPKCGAPQKLSKFYEVILKRKEADNLMDKLIMDPRVRKAIIEALSDLLSADPSLRESLLRRERFEPNAVEDADYSSSSNSMLHNNRVNR